MTIQTGHSPDEGVNQAGVQLTFAPDTTMTVGTLDRPLSNDDQRMTLRDIATSSVKNLGLAMAVPPTNVHVLHRAGTRFLQHQAIELDVRYERGSSARIRKTIDVFYGRALYEFELDTTLSELKSREPVFRSIVHSFRWSCAPQAGDRDGIEGGADSVLKAK